MYFRVKSKRWLNKSHDLTSAIGLRPEISEIRYEEQVTSFIHPLHCFLFNFALPFSESFSFQNPHRICTRGGVLLRNFFPDHFIVVVVPAFSSHIQESSFYSSPPPFPSSSASPPHQHRCRRMCIPCATKFILRILWSVYIYIPWFWLKILWSIQFSASVSGKSNYSTYTIQPVLGTGLALLKHAGCTHILMPSSFVPFPLRSCGCWTKFWDERCIVELVRIQVQELRLLMLSWPKCE